MYVCRRESEHWYAARACIIPLVISSVYAYAYPAGGYVLCVCAKVNVAWYARTYCIAYPLVISTAYMHTPSKGGCTYVCAKVNVGTRPRACYVSYNEERRLGDQRGSDTLVVPFDTSNDGISLAYIFIRRSLATKYNHYAFAHKNLMYAWRLVIDFSMVIFAWCITPYQKTFGALRSLKIDW